MCKDTPSVALNTPSWNLQWHGGVFILLSSLVQFTLTCFRLCCLLGFFSFRSWRSVSFHAISCPTYSIFACRCQTFRRLYWISVKLPCPPLSLSEPCVWLRWKEKRDKGQGFCWSGWLTENEGYFVQFACFVISVRFIVSFLTFPVGNYRLFSPGNASWQPIEGCCTTSR